MGARLTESERKRLHIAQRRVAGLCSNLLAQAVADRCSCGGRGPQDDGVCEACATWHASGAAAWGDLEFQTDLDLLGLIQQKVHYGS